MQPEHIPVGDLFARECTYVVPLFQRPYVWDRERWAPLWDDVARVAGDACRGLLKVRPHFLGSVVLQQRQNGITEGPRREVIDGQQRLTTLQLLFKGVADALAAGEDTEDFARPLRKLLRNEDAPKADAPAGFKVWPTNVDRDRYSAVMRGDGTAKPVEGDRLAAGYAYFHQEAKTWLDEDPSARAARGQALAATLRQRLWLIALNLTTDDQAQVIFETLNARGTPLLPADLVKNLLLRRAEQEGTDPAALYEAHWRPFDTEEAYWRKKVGRGHAERPRVDLFLVQFLTAKIQDTVPPSQLYEHFTDYLAADGKRPVAEHMGEVARWAAIYRELEGSDEASPDRLHTCAARLRAMDFTTAMPVLHHLRAEIGRDPADVAQAATWIESFLVRRMVCGMSTRAYGTFFVELLKAVAGAGSAPVAPAMAGFLLRSQADAGLWPDDERFGEAWTHEPLYCSLRRDRLTMLLRALERAMRGPKHDPVPIPKTLHIEHVMPQNWRAHWPLPSSAEPGAAAEASRDDRLHTIGNLTLLTAKLNQSLSDAAWIVKRPELQRHGLMALNAWLAGHETWDEDTITNRGGSLLTKALAVWPRAA